MAIKTVKTRTPVVLVLVGATLAGFLYIAWDHKSRDYTVAAAPGDVLTLAARPFSMATGIKELLNPSDDQFVALTVRSWEYWTGKGAVSQGHYLRLPALTGESMEAFVRGSRSAASMTFRLDLSLSKSPDFRVLEIVRGGVAVSKKAEDLEIYPLRTPPAPGVTPDGTQGTYRESQGIAWDREDSFRGVRRFVAQGRLEQGDEGLWVHSQSFNVALSPELAPGLAALLNDLANTPQSETAIYYLDLRDGALAADRQESQTLGLAHVDGVDLGAFYVANSP